MAYNINLATRIRQYLSQATSLVIEEKKMFGGLAFLVNGKMCVNVSHQNLMCRFDPYLQEEVEKQRGFQPMIMKGRQFKGYCYVNETGYQSKKDFEYWMQLCLTYNKKAKPGKARKK